jgi:hypothetical protein
MRRAIAAQSGPRSGGARVGEHEDQEVAILFFHARKIGERAGGGAVPGKHVPARADDIGGLLQAADDAADRVGHGLAQKPRPTPVGIAQCMSWYEPSTVGWRQGYEVVAQLS